MYGKLFQSTFAGSMMAAGAEVFAVWAYVIAHTNKTSRVELNPRLLAAVIGSTPDRMQAAIDALCQPDSQSRSKDADGRRLVREGQYQFWVVNHSHYRNIRNEEERREYNRQKKREERARKAQDVKRDVNDMSAVSAHTEADTEEEANTEFNPPNPPASGREPPPEPPPATSRRKKPLTTAAEVPLPDWLDRDLWDTWHSTPKRRRATPSQRQLAIAKLTQWRADGLDWRQALESAALAGWQGLFKPEPARNGNGTGAQRESFRERDLRMARERFEEAAGRRPQSGAQIIDITPGAPDAPSLEYGS